MKKRYSGPQIIAKLRQADVLIGQGKAVPEVCKEIDISQQTYYRWRQKYGGMSPDMIKQLRTVQKENAQLRKLVADQALDISILKVAADWGKKGVETCENVRRCETKHAKTCRNVTKTPQNERFFSVFCQFFNREWTRIDANLGRMGM